MALNPKTLHVSQPVKTAVSPRSLRLGSDRNSILRAKIFLSPPRNVPSGEEREKLLFSQATCFNVADCFRLDR